MTENFIPWKECSPTDRGFEGYLQWLGLEEEDLMGKKILDIGSGLNQFAEDIKNKNLNIDVISLDLFYSLSQKERERLFKDRHSEETFPETKEKLDILAEHGREGKLIAGLAEELPFKDESFDMVFSLFAMPAYAESDEQVKKFVSEVQRVLKKGGSARIYPSDYGGNRGYEYKGKGGNLRQDFAENVKQANIQEISEKEMPRVTVITKHGETQDFAEGAK